MKAITVPEERHAQLARLAVIDGTTIADTIGDFVHTAIHEGRLPDDLPGWTVEADNGSVVFEHPASGFARSLSIENARSVADTLDALAYPAATKPTILLDLDSDVKLSRVGTAIAIEDLAGNRQTVARSIANDLAHLLRKAAAN